jgi:hypothetical protein
VRFDRVALASARPLASVIPATYHYDINFWQ